MSADGIPIRPIEPGDVAGFRDCVDTVMHERRYLAFQQAFSLEETMSFVATNIRTGNPHLVATDASRIIGWCDIRRETVPVHAHCAQLGMGVLDAFRGRGIGERLLRAALDAARDAGIERVALSVYAQNLRAQALYRKVGFVLEGTRKRGKKLDGEYDDELLMAYLF